MGDRPCFFAPPHGGFASLLFDQVVSKNSQRHLAHLHFASIRLCLALLFIMAISMLLG